MAFTCLRSSRNSSPLALSDLVLHFLARSSRSSDCGPLSPRQRRGPPSWIVSRCSFSTNSVLQTTFGSLKSWLLATIEMRSGKLQALFHRRDIRGPLLIETSRQWASTAWASDSVSKAFKN
eukprot:Amastigsp_a847779_5.p2 type:complete len:121 gc:universal Amastigsp_a847779_5:1083-721(-)